MSYCRDILRCTSEEGVLVGEVEGPEVHDGRHRRRLPGAEHGLALGDGQLLQDDPLDQRPHRDGAGVIRANTVDDEYIKRQCLSKAKCGVITDIYSTYREANK